MIRFLRLNAGERLLLLRAAFWLGLIRLGLWLLPFRTLRRFLVGRARAPYARRGGGQASLASISWAVATAGRYLPFSCRCLAQALATQVLLGQSGHAFALRIGVARGEGGGLQAHAWVESKGTIVVGDLDDLTRFRPLPPLEG